MTEKEKEVLNITAELWNKLLELDAHHPADTADAMLHIHAIQRIVMSREARRLHPEFYNQIPG